MESRGTHKLQLKTVQHIGIVVKDIDKVIQSWSSMFGIGPWTVTELGGTDAKGRSWKGKWAFAHLGPLQLELIQTVEGRMIHSRFLETRGEGLHHLSFYVDDVDGEVSNLLAQGAKILVGSPGSWAYVDTGGPGGVIFELAKKSYLDEVEEGSR